jgi:hypothetical protein
MNAGGRVRHPVSLNLALLAVVALTSCSSGPRPQAGREWPVAFLAVGDTGYYYGHLERDEYDPPRTLEQFVAAERTEWLEDGRPPDEFTLPPVHVLETNGGVVAASGLRPVAQAMRRWCDRNSCDFATLLGDNIYPDGATAGADGRSDADRFRDLFVVPFGDLGSGRPDYRMYVTLGNHDWKTSLAGAQAQLEFHRSTPPFYMDGYFYRVRPASAQGRIELFVIDTELLLSQVEIMEAAVTPDGRRILDEDVDAAPPWARDAAADLGVGVQWLEAALAESTAHWKVVIGHHPLWSTAGSKYAQAEALRRLILPALCRYADLYLAGHEHTLELHLDDCSSALPGKTVAPLPEIVSGAGAKQRPVHGPFARRQQTDHRELTTLYARGMVWGFAYVELTEDSAQIRMITTPNDASGVPALDYSYSARRRTSQVAGSR